jgi:hypothetical protein
LSQYSSLSLVLHSAPCMMVCQRLLLQMALLLLTLLAAAVIVEGDVVVGSANSVNATDAEPPDGATLDVRARKWWRFPPAEDLVRGSERRVPNSSDPLHNR